MRKILFPILILGILIGMSNCEQEPTGIQSLGGEVNPFIGTWEDAWTTTWKDYLPTGIIHPDFEKDVYNIWNNNNEVDNNFDRFVFTSDFTVIRTISSFSYILLSGKKTHSISIFFGKYKYDDSELKITWDLIDSSVVTNVEPSKIYNVNYSIKNNELILDLITRKYVFKKLT